MSWYEAPKSSERRKKLTEGDEPIPADIRGKKATSLKAVQTHATEKKSMKKSMPPESEDTNGEITFSPLPKPKKRRQDNQAASPAGNKKDGSKKIRQEAWSLPNGVIQPMVLANISVFIGSPHFSTLVVYFLFRINLIHHFLKEAIRIRLQSQLTVRIVSQELKRNKNCIWARTTW